MIKIREATENDIDTLYQLILDIAKYHDQEEHVITNKEEMIRSGFGNSPKFGALLAERNGEIVGYLSYTWNYSIWNGVDYMNLDDLFVTSEQRGKNVGLQLMQHAQNLCKGNAVGLMRWEVQKDNVSAIKFYNRLGAKMAEKGIFRWKLPTNG